MTSRSLFLGSLLLAAPLFAVACGDGTPTADAPPQPTGAPTADVTAAPTAEPTAAPTAEPTAEPTAAPTAAPSAAPDKPKSSGRPPVMLSDPKSITDTFGFSPGAKLELGDKELTTLRIPEGAFTTATNVTFAHDTKCKTTGLVFGKTYKITPTIPPSAAPVAVPSNNGSPFIFVLPTGKKKDLNLAIGNFTKDAKGNDAIKWTIVAPKSSDEAAATVQFELDTLPDGCIHLTNKAPS